MLFSGIFGLKLFVWAMRPESAKDLVRMCFFEKKLSLFEEVIIFSIISFKIGLIGLGNIVFSGIFGLEPVVWAIWTVNLQ